MRKKKKDTTFVVEQEVVKTGVETKDFDILLRFTKGIDQSELFVDELTQLVLEGLIERYGQIVVKINWWAEGLTVIAPNDIPAQNALEAPSQPITEAIPSNPSPNTKDNK